MGGAPKVEKHAEGEEIPGDICTPSPRGDGQLGKRSSLESRSPCSSEHRRNGENQSPQACWIQLCCTSLLYHNL